MSGIDLVDVGGAIAQSGDEPKLGVRLPAGQVARMAGQNSDEHGMSLSDITASLRLMMNVPAPEPRLRNALLDELRDQAAASRAGHPNRYPATVQFLSAFIEDLGRQASPAVDLATAGTPDVYLTGLQSWLILVAVAGGMAEAGALVVAHRPPPSAAPKDIESHCTIDDTTGKILDWAAIAFGAATGGITFTAWGGLATLLKSASGTNPGNPYDGSDYLSWVNGLLSLARVVIESTTFTATLEMVGGEPLVRTKQTHGYDQRRVLKLHASFDIGKGQYANCLRLMINQAGLDFSLPNNGPIAGANVQWEMSQDPGGVLNNPTEFYIVDTLPGGANGAGVASTTDDSGDTRMGLEGLPQRHELPPSPQTYLRTVQIYAALKVKDDTVYGDLTDAISALGAGSGAIASIISGLIERTHAFSVHKGFQVKDWAKDFRFDVTLDNHDPDHPGTVRLTGTKCDGVAGRWVITVNQTFHRSVTLDRAGNATTPTEGDKIPGIPDDLQVRYVTGTPPSLVLSLKGIDVITVPLTPGHFCKS